MSSKQNSASNSSRTSGATDSNVQNVYTHMKEYYLPDLRIHSQFVDESLQAILHTLLFVRAPPDVRPKDINCEKLAPIIFASCGISDMESKINATIESLKRSLVISSSGQHLRGEITLSFYQRKENKGWLYNNIDHVYFEKWHIPVAVLDLAPSPSNLHSNNNNNNFNNNSVNNNNGNNRMVGGLSASTMMLPNNNYSSSSSNTASSSSQRRHSSGGGGGSSSSSNGFNSFNNSSSSSSAGIGYSFGLDESTTNNEFVNTVDPVKSYSNAYDLTSKSIMFILESVNTIASQVPTTKAYFELNVSDVQELRKAMMSMNRNNSGAPPSSSSSSSSTTNTTMDDTTAAGTANLLGKLSPMIPTSLGRRI